MLVSLICKGNGEGASGGAFREQSRASDEMADNYAVVERVQPTWHEPSTRKYQLIRQTILYPPAAHSASGGFTTGPRQQAVFAMVSLAKPRPRGEAMEAAVATAQGWHARLLKN